jgi:hypothetical protein
MPDSWRLGLSPDRLLSGVALCLSIHLIGCTRAHVAGPPPLQVPGPPLAYVRGPVNDLAAIRAENHVSLTWTMPRKRTDRLTVDGTIAVRVWRGEERTDLTEIGDVIHLAPGTTGSFSEELPQALSLGRVRLLYYFVDLLDRDGRSTGLSNYVPTIAGGPPPVVQGLTAEMTETGVLLHWTPSSAGEESEPMGVRIRRVVLLDRPTDEKQWLSAHSSLEQNLFVEDGSRSGHALDKDVQYGYTYDYQAQYVDQLRVSKHAVLELRGSFSAPSCIHTEKVILSEPSAKSAPVSDCP